MQCHCISIVRIWPEELRTSTCAPDNLCLAFISREAPSLNASECRFGSLNRFIRPVRPRVSRQLTGPTATRSNPTNEPAYNQPTNVYEFVTLQPEASRTRQAAHPSLPFSRSRLVQFQVQRAESANALHPSIQLSLPPPPSPCYIPRRSKHTVGEG